MSQAGRVAGTQAWGWECGLGVKAGWGPGARPAPPKGEAPCLSSEGRFCWPASILTGFLPRIFQPACSCPVPRQSDLIQI